MSTGHHRNVGLLFLSRKRNVYNKREAVAQTGSITRKSITASTARTSVRHSQCQKGEVFIVQETSLQDREGLSKAKQVFFLLAEKDPKYTAPTPKRAPLDDTEREKR